MEQSPENHFQWSIFIILLLIISIELVSSR